MSKEHEQSTEPFKMMGNWTNLKTIAMRNILYIIAIVLVIVWATGFFAYSAGYLIHLLLVIALISVLLGIIKRNNI